MMLVFGLLCVQDLLVEDLQRIGEELISRTIREGPRR